jgi:hypothetical protein
MKKGLLSRNNFKNCKFYTWKTREKWKNNTEMKVKFIAKDWNCSSSVHVLPMRRTGSRHCTLKMEVIPSYETLPIRLHDVTTYKTTIRL